MTEGASRVIAGRYRLIEPLGHGGMGVVWRARDEVLGREVAVKEIRLPTTGSAPDDLVDLMARRALREAQAAARLRHPAIVTVHDVVTDDGRPWIVMELIRGRSLAEVIATDGVLPARRSAEIGLKVLGALDAAHRHGILHRDVKPANILLDGDRVVLTDFGIAIIDGATALTATGLLVGSPDYLAPERINGRPPTAAVDMWGLGVTLYAALAGRPPFHRADTQSTLAAVLVSEPTPLTSAPDLWPVIRGLLAKSPETRLAATDAIPLLTAITGQPPAASPRQRRWTAMFSGRSRSRATSQPTSPAAPVSATTAAADSRNAEATRIAESGPNARNEEQDSQAPIGTWLPARTAALIASSAVALLLLGMVAWVTWRRPDDPTEPHTRGVAAPTASSAGIGNSRPSSSSWPSSPPVQTTPPGPAGFKTVGRSSFTIAVPRSWTDLTLGQNSTTFGEAGTLISVTISYSARNEPMVAETMLVENRVALPGVQQYKWLRLTRLPTIEGAGSVAEEEYTLLVPIFHQSRYNHAINRAYVTTTGTGLYLVDARVAAGSQSAILRDWQQAQVTLTTVLNSFRLTSS